MSRAETSTTQSKMILTPVQSANKFEVGQILSCSWGYSMTIVNYYVVTRITEKSVWVKEIDRSVTNDDGMGNGKAMPDLTKRFVDDSKPMRFKIQRSDDGTESIWWSKKQRSIRIWDQRPEYFNTWD